MYKTAMRHHPNALLKVTATDMRYFAGSKLFGSLVHKKNFGLIWQVVFKLGYLFCQGRYDTTFEVEWTWIKIGETIIIGKFVNKPSSNKP